MITVMKNEASLTVSALLCSSIIDAGFGGWILSTKPLVFRPYRVSQFTDQCSDHRLWSLLCAALLSFILASFSPAPLSRPFNKPGMWRMCLGKHHMNSSWDGPTEQCVPVDTLVSHEAFVYPEDNTDITNDIALVHLAKPVKMTAQVRPVCMPTPDFVLPAGETCFVTGWGDEKGQWLAPVDVFLL